MGTKRTPGDFDAYDAAEPDEPMFVLIGRDGDAPDLVEEWARIREEKGENPAKVAEARACAHAMRAWHATRRTFALAQGEALAILEQAMHTGPAEEKQWLVAEAVKALGGQVPEGVSPGEEPF